MNRPNLVTGGDWYGFEYMYECNYGIFFNSLSVKEGNQFDRGSQYLSTIIGTVNMELGFILIIFGNQVFLCLYL